MNPGAVPNHHHFSNGTIITDDQSNTPCKHDLRWMGSETFGDSWIINKTDFLNTIGDYFCEPGHIVANTTLNCVSITFYDYFVRNLEPTHVATHILESDAPTPNSPNPQVIYEVNFESLFGLIEIDLESES